MLGQTRSDNVLVIPFPSPKMMLHMRRNAFDPLKMTLSVNDAQAKVPFFPSFFSHIGWFFSHLYGFWQSIRFCFRHHSKWLLIRSPFTAHLLFTAFFLFHYFPSFLQTFVYPFFSFSWTHTHKHTHTLTWGLAISIRKNEKTFRSFSVHALIRRPVCLCSSFSHVGLVFWRDLFHFFFLPPFPPPPPLSSPFDPCSASSCPLHLPLINFG